MNSNYLANSLLNFIMGESSYGSPADIWLGLYTEMPTTSGGGTEATNYTRLSIGSKLGIASSGSIENTEVLTMDAPIQNIGNVEAVGFFDAQVGGNLLGVIPIAPVNVTNTVLLMWGIGKLSISYLQDPDTLDDWELRPKDVYDGYLLMYSPTQVLYRFSKYVKDYIRNEIYEAYHLDLKAELSGNYLPLDEPEYPWDSYTLGSNITDPLDYISLYTDVEGKDWVKMDNTLLAGQANSNVTLDRNLSNPLGSYFVQGWVHVPTRIPSSLSFNRSTPSLFLFGARQDTEFYQYTFSSHTGASENGITHIGSSSITPTGSYIYQSPKTNTNSVWVEIYYMTDSEDSSKFKTVLYVNHNKEPFHYSDQSFPSQNSNTPSESKAHFGLTSSHNYADARFRDFKVGNLTRRTWEELGDNYSVMSLLYGTSEILSNEVHEIPEFLTLDGASSIISNDILGSVITENTTLNGASGIDSQDFIAHAEITTLESVSALQSDDLHEYLEMTTVVSSSSLISEDVIEYLETTTIEGESTLGSEDVFEFDILMDNAFIDAFILGGDPQSEE